MPGVSVSPLTFIGLWVLICVGAFLIGLRFSRMTESPRADFSLEQAHRFGRLMMMGATAMLFFVGALWLHGDLKNIRGVELTR
jgi:hypothetical protein